MPCAALHAYGCCDDLVNLLGIACNRLLDNTRSAYPLACPSVQPPAVFCFLACSPTCRPACPGCPCCSTAAIWTQGAPLGGACCCSAHQHSFFPGAYDGILSGRPYCTGCCNLPLCDNFCTAWALMWSA
jgi:hypothetical protein